MAATMPPESTAQNAITGGDGASRTGYHISLPSHPPSVPQRSMPPVLRTTSECYHRPRVASQHWQLRCGAHVRGRVGGCHLEGPVGCFCHANLWALLHAHILATLPAKKCEQAIASPTKGTDAALSPKFACDRYRNTPRFCTRLCRPSMESRQSPISNALIPRPSACDKVTRRIDEEANVA